MMRFTHIVYLCFIVSILLSCTNSKKALTASEYKNWYSSNGFIWKTSDTINQLTYSFRYLPQEVDLAICALENCRSRDDLKKESKSKVTDYYFLFEISTLNWNQSVFDFTQPELTKSEILTYLNGQIVQDLKGVSKSNDSLSCTSVIYEPLSGNKVRLLVGFEAKSDLKEIVFFDRVFTGFKQTFSIPELTIKSTPTLKL